MTSNLFGAFIELESSSTSTSGHQEAQAIPVVPQKAVERTYHSVPLPQGPDAIELDNLQWGSKLNGPRGESGHNPASETQTPGVADVEMSRPATPKENEHSGIEIVQSFSNPPMNRFRMLSICLMLFGNGMMDAAPGALIPYIERYLLYRL